MVKKVFFVLGLFLFVDRVMYYKLGQGFHQGRHAFSSACVTAFPCREQRDLLKKKRMRDRVALYTRVLLQKMHGDSQQKGYLIS